MAILSITIPDGIAAKLGAACKADLGPDGSGLTNAQAIKEIAVRGLKHTYRRYCLGVDVATKAAAAQRTAQVARTAETNARAALKNAETTISAQVDTDFSGVS